MYYLLKFTKDIFSTQKLYYLYRFYGFNCGEYLSVTIHNSQFIIKKNAFI